MRRRLKPEVGRRLIENARDVNRLLCVSKDDLIAPYHKHRRENHDALRRMLKKRFGIALTIKDFTSPYDAEDGVLHSINPLCFAAISARSQLLVIICSYTLNKTTKNKMPSFRIAPDTVEFHLIESARK